jgi:hypothetical protein
MERLFGGNPLGVLLRLAVISIIVGIVLVTLDIRPQDLMGNLQRIVRNIWHMGFDSFRWLGQYLLIGAIVVVPIWLVMRLISLGRGAKPDKKA